MIPRLSPPFDASDLLSILKGWTKKDGVQRFERAFAAWCGKPFALAFPYCRSALYTLIRVHGWRDKEIILPAYTCASMPSTILASGNRPRFIDLEENRVTMSMEEAALSLNRDTRAIIITPMYGFPVGSDGDETPGFKNGGVLSIHDRALGLGATSLTGHFSNSGSLDLFSFSIGKHMSTGEGGMAVTSDRTLYEALKDYRDRYFMPVRQIDNLKQMLFFLSSWIGSFSSLYPVTYFIAYRTNFLKSLINHYDPYRATLPVDAFQLPGSLMGRLGENQVKKINLILKKKERIAKRYFDAFKGLEGISLPHITDGSTYSHFPCTVENRKGFLEFMLSRGIHVGTEVFDYVASNLPVFEKYSEKHYPNSERLSREVVLLPIHYRISEREVDRVITSTIKWSGV